MKPKQPCQLVQRRNLPAGPSGLLGNLLAGVFLCHLKQLHLVALLRQQQLHAALCLLTKIFLQLLLAAGWSVQNDRLGHLLLHVIVAQHKLGPQLLHHRFDRLLLAVCERGVLCKLAQFIEHEVFLVHQAVIPKLQNHRTAFDRRLHQSDDVLLLIANGHHLLIFCKTLNGTDAVAVTGSLVILHRFCRLHHLLGQNLLDVGA